MITFVQDARMVPAVAIKVKAALDKLTANDTVKELLAGVHLKVMYTNLRPDGQALQTGTGIGTQDQLLNPVTGLGPDYNYVPIAATGQTGYDLILLVAQSALDHEVEAQGYDGSFMMSLSRVLFHEIMHTRFDWPAGSNNTIFEEEIVIFLENLFYRKIASEIDETDTDVRYGHGHDPYDGHGVSGIGSFLAYLNSPTGTIEIDAAGTNKHMVTFIAEDEAYTLSKVFFGSGHQIGEYAFDHYTRLTEAKSVGSYLTTSKSGYSIDPRFWTVTSDMVGKDVSAALDMAVDAAKLLTALAPGLSISYNRITGLANDGFTENGLRFSGPASYGSSDTAMPARIFIHDAAASASDNTIVIGPGGLHGDRLYAGSGDDLIIASGSVENMLYGNDGNDILIGRSGANILDGGSGTDTAYYGDRSQGVIVYDGLGRVEHDGVVDKFISVEQFIGTKHRDVFVADGQGHTFYGNGGNDEFLAANGGDTFRGLNGAIAGTISFAALTSSDNEIGETGTNLGHVYDRASIIIGSSQRDIITMSSTANIAIRAGGGNDDITVGKGNAYGEAGDDTFHVVPGINGSIIDGGNGQDTIVFESTYVDNAWFSINWIGNTKAYGYYTGSGYVNGDSLVNIENFEFSKDGVAIYANLQKNTVNTITGTNYGNDQILGGDLKDIIHAGGSASYVSASGYHNTLIGGLGDDELHGATNASLNLAGDYLDGGYGKDIIFGSAGKDHIRGGYGPGDDDELHGGDGNDIFYDSSGTNHIWGDGGTDTLYIDAYSLSQLTFGTAGDWHVVQANDGSFTNYLKGVERIVTKNGTVGADGVRASRAAGDSDDFHIVDEAGFDFSGFDMTPKPDAEFVEAEVSSTGEGPFYLISEHDDWDFGPMLEPQQEGSPIFQSENSTAGAPITDPTVSDGYVGPMDLAACQQEIEPMSQYGYYPTTPLFHDWPFF